MILYQKKNIMERFAIIVYDKLLVKVKPTNPALGLLKIKQNPGRENKKQIIKRLRKFFLVSFW